MIKPNLSLNGCPCAERGFPPLVLPRAFGHCLSQQPPRHRPHSPLPAARPQIGRSGPCPAPLPLLRLTAPSGLGAGHLSDGRLGCVPGSEQSLQTPAVAALPGPWVRPMGCLLPVTQLLKPLPLAPAQKTRPL